MKKKITGLFAALMLLSSVTFANDGTQPSEELQKVFNHVFAQSTDVKWERVNDYYKASFIQDGQYLMVFFNSSNRIEAVSRNISIYTLPLILQKSLRDKLSESSWIADCFEIFGKTGTEYYVVIENADQKITYQARENNWEVYRKHNK